MPHETVHSDAPAIRKWWRIGGFAGTAKSGQWLLRPSDIRTYQRIESVCYRGKKVPLAKWSPPRFAYDSFDGKPDIAWDSGSGPFVVSDRLRKFIELHAPLSGQFLPIVVDGPRRHRLDRNYWLVNWLAVWDCQPHSRVAEIDPLRIPAHHRLGIVGGDGWGWSRRSLCDGVFRQQCLAHDFHGLRFEVILASSLWSAFGTYRDPKTGKPVQVPKRCLPYDRRFKATAFLSRFPNDSYVSATPDASALHEYIVHHSAGKGVNFATLKALLESGQDPNSDIGHAHLDPMLVCLDPKTPEILRLFQRFGARWNVANAVGITPLMSAVGREPAASVRLLLRFGADPRARETDGRTALHDLCDVDLRSAAHLRECIASARLLIKAGADGNARDDRLRTPLDCFDAQGHGGEGPDKRWRRAFRKVLVGLGCKSGSTAAL